MRVKLDNLVSITEANQNFSKIARMVDENGTVVILKNNAPKYVLVDYSLIKDENVDSIEEEKIEYVIEKVLKK